ncbi:ABC transporter permease [Roseibium sp. SCP14]|uniref:ABC transporter permease n=1 Tax=Roseibium sp. SCP14 TaxID=3141375 RepID=UPI003339CFFE
MTAVDSMETAAMARSETLFGRNLRNFASNKVSVLFLFITFGFVLTAIAAPLIAPHDPNEADLFRRLLPPAWMSGGSWEFPLGCDALGRDILSRIIYGSRVSIFIGLAVILVATTIGVLAGLAAGYLKGWVDVVISRLVDILLGFPYLIFAIALIAMTGPGLQNIILALAYKEWVIPCRVVRGETLATAGAEYVEAAHALGASKSNIMLREILPNIMSPVLVVSTVRMAHVIILEASLSFLGIGVQPPTASWGSMVADGRSFMLNEWWLATFPGLAILLLVLSINVVSQGLRDAFDPKFHD